MSTYKRITRDTPTTKLTVPVQVQGSPRLKTVSIKVQRLTPDLDKLFLRMALALKESIGVGIAANQVGDARKVCIVAPPQEEARILINPEIVWHGTETARDGEGCLSVPGWWAYEVERWTQVQVRYRDPHWHLHTWKVEGFTARIVQHELDHLAGLLMTDRVPYTMVVRAGRPNPRYHPEPQGPA